MLVKPLVRSIVRSIAGVPTNSLGSGFSPTSLFADGSKGVVYDNNDLSSFYLDSAGTTAATVNGLVGLQLDKSANLALGAELLSTGAVGLTGSATVATYNTGTGAGTVTRVDGANQSFVTFTGLSATTFYQVTIQNTGSNILSFRQGTFASTILGDIGVGETKTFLGLATISQLTITMSPVAGSGSFTVVSFKAQSGNHRYQTTTGSKPVLRGTPTGANLAPSNGDFSSATGWTLQSGWTISGGTANVNSAVAGSTYARASGTSVIGKVYRITFTITSFTSGAVYATAGTAAGGGASAVGTYVVYLTANTTDGCGLYAAGTTTVASVDNIEVVDVSAGAVTAPYGLQYDGVDDFLQTAAVDFTATDKMFVCAGVRKLSDAARGAVVDMGAGINGGFNIEAPSNAAANDFVYRNGGTLSVNAQETGNVSPITSVITGLGNISGDTCTLRKNGVQVAQTLTDQGTGNYGNYVVYFGRRGGTVIPYNGLDFGFVICGKTLTSTQIANTERWMSYRTGVTL